MAMLFIAVISSSTDKIFANKLLKLSSLLPEEANPYKTDERQAENENTHEETMTQFLFHCFLRSNYCVVSTG